MGRQDKGVPCLLLRTPPAPQGMGYLGVAAPPPFPFIPETVCLCFSDLSRSVFQLAHSCSFPPLLLFLPLKINFFQGSLRWETLKWMRFQSKQLRQMGNFLGKSDDRHSPERGFGFGT